MLILISGIFFFSSSSLAQTSFIDVVFSAVKQPEENHFSTNEFPTITHAFSFKNLEVKVAEGRSFRTTICFTKNQRPVEAYYFPGSSSKRALIIGGVHGSELSSIELAYHIIGQLSKGEKPFFSVIILPSLFPDNAARAMEVAGDPFDLKGRYTSETSPDPNRQMPPLGHPFDPSAPFDMLGREIEKENQYLLQLIQEYKPERIANLHAIRKIENAGIFADPRTDQNGTAIGFSSDSLLALSMNKIVCLNGGSINSISPENIPVVYHNDPSVVPAGLFQPRNLQGSKLPGQRGHGTSLGSWATTAVCNDDTAFSRNALSLITVEFPGYKSSIFQKNEEKFNYFLNLRLFSLALTSVFLQP